jgi:quercetin dioxygenase-like cupin family protein
MSKGTGSAASGHSRRNQDVETMFIRQVEGVANFGDVRMKPLIAGDQMTLLEIKYAPEAGAGLHIHQHETVCYVVSGKVQVTVGDEVFELGPGDVCVHPRGMKHGIRGLEQATVIEVKSPAQPISAFLRTQPEKASS